MKNTFILSLYNIVLHFSLGFISKTERKVLCEALNNAQKTLTRVRITCATHDLK